MAQSKSKLGPHYFAPNHAQLTTAVKGNDPHYRIQPKRPIWLGYALALFILLCAVCGGLVLLVNSMR